MGFIEILMLAVALSMDCLAVSIVSGVIMSRPIGWPSLRMAILFGLFQALMPLFGWLGISLFRSYVEAYDHWIAFGILLFLGGNMIRESLSASDDSPSHFHPEHLFTQLMLAVATSIDAMAIGITLACTGYSRLSALILPLAVIGAVSFLFSIIGYTAGYRFGHSIERRLKPEFLGGCILILIGIRILITSYLPS